MTNFETLNHILRVCDALMELCVHTLYLLSINLHVAFPPNDSSGEHVSLGRMEEVRISLSLSFSPYLPLTLSLSLSTSTSLIQALIPSLPVGNGWFSHCFG